MGAFTCPKAANVGMAGAGILGLILLAGMSAVVMSFVVIPVTGQVVADAGMGFESFPHADPPKIDLAHDEESLTLYEQEFDAAAAELERNCNSASEAALEAFAKYFVPGAVGRKLKAVRRALQGQLAAFRATRPPADTEGETERAIYAAQVRLVTGLLKAAGIRLASIDKSASFTNDNAVASPLNNIPFTSLSSTKLKQQNSSLVGFSSFVEALGNRPVPSDMPTGEQGLPEVLVRKLTNAVLASDMHIEHDTQVLAVFNEYVSGIGKMPSIEEQAADVELLAQGERLPMPRGARPFPLALFKTVLNGFGQFHSDFRIPADVIKSWAENWTIEGALSHLRELEQRQKTRLEVLLATKKDIVQEWLATQAKPLKGTDLFTLCVFLL